MDCELWAVVRLSGIDLLPRVAKRSHARELRMRSLVLRPHGEITASNGASKGYTTEAGRPRPRRRAQQAVRQLSAADAIFLDDIFRWRLPGQRGDAWPGRLESGGQGMWIGAHRSI